MGIVYVTFSWRFTRCSCSPHDSRVHRKVRNQLSSSISSWRNPCSPAVHCIQQSSDSAARASAVVPSRVRDPHATAHCGYPYWSHSLFSLRSKLADQLAVFRTPKAGRAPTRQKKHSCLIENQRVSACGMSDRGVDRRSETDSGAWSRIERRR